MTLDEVLHSTKKDEVYSWLDTANPRDILKYLQFCLAPSSAFPPEHLDKVKASLDIRLSEDAAENTNKLITGIDKLIGLTHALHWLTIGLFAVAILQTVILVIHH